MGKVPNTPEVAALCLCGNCPSYPSTGGFFCAVGKSSAEVAQRGCICGDCANFTEYGLEDGYYCIAGIAGEGAQ